MTKRNSTGVIAPKQVKKYVRNTEQFIAKATELHNGVYDYSKSVYVTATDKMIITCKIHGDFLLSSNKHLKKVGCRKCAYQKVGKKRRKTTEQFISEATKTHSGRYTYEKAEYKGADKKVLITCPSHGDFWQVASSHLLGTNCPDCYQESRFLTQDEFLSRSIKAHGLGKFDYSEAVYVSSNDKVKITCNTCADIFYQEPDRHMRGGGCRNCAGTKPVEVKDFIAQAVDRYGNRFDYTNISWINNDTPIEIICGLHGSFFQRPRYHLVGDGCPKCSQSKQGYTRTNFVEQCEKNSEGIGTLYVIECSNELESFYKVGRTSNTVKGRYPSNYHMPYDYKEVYLVQNSPDYIYDLENELHRLLAEHSYSPLMPFAGQTECFTTIKPIEKLLRQLSSTYQLQLIA